MAASPTPDPSEIRRKGRQRLIGAVAIVLLAVVFVPMLLDPQPRQERKEPSFAIPPKQGAPALPAPEAASPEAKAPAQPASSAKTAEPEKAAAAKPVEPEKPAPKTATAKPAEPEKPAPPPKTATVKPAEPEKPAPAPKAAAGKPGAKPAAAAKAAAPKLEGFAVQVGAFRDEGKLALAREKLVAARVAHYTERLDSPSGALTRLRAGPYPTREAAEKAAEAIARAGLEGKVVPLP